MCIGAGDYWCGLRIFNVGYSMKDILMNIEIIDLRRNKIKKGASKLR